MADETPPNVLQRHEFFSSVSGVSRLGVVLCFFSFIIFSFYFTSPGLLFENSDFEQGHLAHWHAEGKAFVLQPTFGDNGRLRNRGASYHVGNYWIGTFEARPQAGDRPGAAQGEEPTGRLVSDPFIITHRAISFLVGGGKGTRDEGVVLEVDGKEVYFEPGRGESIGGEGMVRRRWDVSPWMGRKARLILVDNSSAAWGHVNADDFRWA